MDRGSKWVCFVEVNLSGDFNGDFPFRDTNGMPDPEINGQPSLIYQGKIKAIPNQIGYLKLIGRTDQWVAVDHIIKDLSGITTAKNAITNLLVTCHGDVRWNPVFLEKAYLVCWNLFEII